MATDVRIALCLYLEMYSIMKIANISIEAQSNYMFWILIKKFSNS